MDKPNEFRCGEDLYDTLIDTLCDAQRWAFENQENATILACDGSYFATVEFAKLAW